MAEVRHDNAALLGIKRKIRVYTLAIKALRTYKGGLKMDAVKFLKEWRRMCTSYNDDCHDDFGKSCPVPCPIAMDEISDKYIEFTVETVEKWSANYPQKTMAVPARHGRWIRQDDTFTRFKCSACGDENHKGNEKYCSSCGAKMDLELNDVLEEK